MEPILTVSEHELRHGQACLMVETLHHSIDNMDVGPESQGEKLLILAGLYGLLECLQRLAPQNIINLEGLDGRQYSNGILLGQ